MLFAVPTAVKLIETALRTEVSKDCGQEKMENYCLMRIEFQFEKMKMFWRLMVVIFA